MEEQFTPVTKAGSRPPGAGGGVHFLRAALGRPWDPGGHRI